MLTSNINSSSNTIQPVKEPWFILEYIEGVKLTEFKTSGLNTFCDKARIALQLLHIVERMHSRNVVHRSIRPENIIVSTKYHSNDVKNMNLFFIDFRQACHIHQKQIDPTIHFEDSPYDINDLFYQPPQFERLPLIDQESDTNTYKNRLCHPSIDLSFICAILFWLITGEYPKESRNIREEPPHCREKFARIINDELARATGK